MSGQSISDVNSIFLGEVASVQTYGVFVKIPGCSHQGLVHRSQISKHNVPDVSEVLSKSDRVWCKVISNADDGKIGLSMKVVDQGNGKDLDPNGVQIKLDEQRRKEWTPGDKRKTISLEAVFNTTCSKCGTRGHLSKDCFQVAGGKTYDLIPEDGPGTSDILPPSNVECPETLRDEKKTRKESKKDKKEAKRRKKAAKKLKKKLKKEAKKAKKHKRKKEEKHSSSGESSDSSEISSGSDSDKNENSSHSSKRDHKKNPDASNYRHPPRRTRSRSTSRETKRHKT